MRVEEGREEERKEWEGNREERGEEMREVHCSSSQRYNISQFRARESEG